MPNRGTTRRSFYAAAWLIVVPIAVHWPELTGWLSSNPLYLTSGLGENWKSDGFLAGLPGWIDGNAGATLQALGHLAARDWMSGTVPWWNPYSGVGMPLAGEMQPAAFFLPFVLLLGTGPGVLVLKIAMQGLAGLSTWGLLRRLGVSHFAALVGGILFELNGTFAWASDTPILPIAFLPLLLLGVERALHAARHGRPGGWVLIAIALFYSLVAGFPETAYLDGLLALAWAGLRFGQAGPHRWHFAARIVGGGTAGLALAAPLLVAFASFLTASDRGRHLAHFPFPRSLFTQFLLPYAYGPIFFAGRLDWYLLGGYTSLAAVALTILGLAGQSRGRQRPLRWLLAVWVFLVMAKTADCPGVTALWNLLPFIPQTMVFRYGAPSWELALILSACLALDDVTESTHLRRRFALLSGGCTGLLCLFCLALGLGVVRSLRGVPGGGTWFLVAVSYGLVAIAGITFASMRSAARHRRAWSAGILIADAVLQFTVPLLSGTRQDQRQIETGIVSFLHDHLGLQRFYTLGPFSPNYGAYFGLASINHIYAPQPAAWVGFIRAALDPHADPTTFNGSTPPPSPGVETRQQAFSRLMPNFAGIGVKYVVAQAWSFSAPAASSRGVSDRTALQLVPGQAAAGHFAAGEFGPGDVQDAALVIGTYAGSASGALRLQLCTQAGVCVEDTAPLGGALDNAPLPFTFHHLLPLSTSGRLDFKITHDGGTTPVAVWLLRGAAPSASEVTPATAVQAGYAPDLRLDVQSASPSAQLVYRDRHAEILELPHVAPYFEAPRQCSIAVEGRSQLIADCKTKGRLLRRELMFPGWSAQISGTWTDLGTDGLFQTIQLPAGQSIVHFSFTPPHETPAFLVFLASFSCIAASLVRTVLGRGPETEAHAG